MTWRPESSVPPPTNETGGSSSNETQPVRGVAPVEAQLNQSTSVEPYEGPDTYHDYARDNLLTTRIIDVAGGTVLSRKNMVAVSALPVMKAAQEERSARQDESSAPPVRVIDVHGGEAEHLIKLAARKGMPVKETRVAEYFGGLGAADIAYAAARSIPGTDADRDAAEYVFSSAMRKISETTGIPAEDLRIGFDGLAEVLSEMRGEDVDNRLPSSVQDAVTEPPMFKQSEKSAIGVNLFMYQEHARMLAERTRAAESLYEQPAWQLEGRPLAEIISVPEDVDPRVRDAFAASLLARARTIRESQRVIVTGADLMDPKFLGPFKTSLGNPDHGTQAIYTYPLDGLYVGTSRGKDSGFDLFGVGGVKGYMRLDESTAEQIAQSSGTRNGLRPTGVTDDVGGSLERGKSSSKGSGESSKTNSRGLNSSGSLNVSYGTDARANILPEYIYKMYVNTIIFLRGGQVTGPMYLWKQERAPKLPQIQEPRVPDHVKQAYMEGHPAPGAQNRPPVVGVNTRAQVEAQAKEILAEAQSEPQRIDYPENWLIAKSELLSEKGIWRGSRRELVRRWKRTGLPVNAEGLAEFLLHNLDMHTVRTGDGLVYWPKEVEKPVAPNRQQPVPQQRRDGQQPAQVEQTPAGGILRKAGEFFGFVEGSHAPQAQTPAQRAPEQIRSQAQTALRSERGSGDRRVDLMVQMEHLKSRPMGPREKADYDRLYWEFQQERQSDHNNPRYFQDPQAEPRDRLARENLVKEILQREKANAARTLRQITVVSSKEQPFRVTDNPEILAAQMQNRPEFWQFDGAALLEAAKFAISSWRHTGIL